MLATEERTKLVGQQREPEWLWQWSHMQGEEHQSEKLFWEWVHPLTPDDFRGKRVLDGGCGGGHMLDYLKDIIKTGVGVDMNTADLVQKRFQGRDNIRIYQGDLATFNEEDGFDIVYSIGVVHHTQDPLKSARNLMRLVKPGGKLVIWVYGHEGNFWTRVLVEAPKKLYAWMPRSWLWGASLAISACMYPIIYSVYKLPLTSLPYYDYFRMWRGLSFIRNATNVFDKLNAPTTHFIKRGDIDQWYAGQPFGRIHVSPWCNLSWRTSATKTA